LPFEILANCTTIERRTKRSAANTEQNEQIRHNTSTTYQVLTSATATGKQRVSRQRARVGESSTHTHITRIQC